MNLPKWKFEQIALLSADHVSGRVDLAHPETGFQLQSVHGNANNDCNVFAASHRPAVERRLVDHYVRANDLICTYRTDDKSDELQITEQVYWRVLTEESALGCSMEVMVSLQTDLLGLSPRVQLHSSFARCKLYAIAETGSKPIAVTESSQLDGDTIAVQLVSDDGWSYIQALHPRDSDSCEAIELEFENNRISINTILFVDHLEKGVIRRARMRGTFCDSPNPPAAEFQKWYAQFIESELPLTV